VTVIYGALAGNGLGGAISLLVLGKPELDAP
jgi:hypothetical protein